MRVHSFIMMVTIAVAVAACQDTPSPIASLGRPSNEIVDGAHSGGNPFFHFLPPMVANPGSGVNLTGVSPVVDICLLDAFGCATPIAHFTTSFANTWTTQPGNSETVRQSSDGYIVNWHTADFDLAVGGLYRICVSLNDFQLGHADVDVVGSGKDLKNVNTSEFIGLLDGRTLPIKFRIESRFEAGPADFGCGSPPV